jgi:hypothetical protein
MRLPNLDCWSVILLACMLIGFGLQPLPEPYRPATKLAWQEPRWLGKSLQQHWKDRAWYCWAEQALRILQPLKLSQGHLPRSGG